MNIVVIPRPEGNGGWNASDTSSGITLLWEYNTDLFNASTITRMTNQFKVLLNGALADPGKRLQDLPLGLDVIELEQEEIDELFA